MQHEIKKAELLLKEDGDLKEPGYAKKLLPIYRRSDIRANPLKIKEWNYYLINNVISKGKDYLLSFRHEEGKRILEFQMEQFADNQPIQGQLILMDEPEESMVIATPFDKKAHFYYNQKINCMRVKGQVKVLGKDYLFSPEDSFAVLDWGRGVWTYKNTWYWGSASGQVKGKTFGFNLGYGFGDTSAATENMLFYEGKAHKLNDIRFNIPLKSDGKEDYLKPWTITSDDGRVEMDFEPILDRAACTSLLILESDQHQVFGRFAGKAVLDDGTIVNIDNLMGFAEKVINKW